MGREDPDVVDRTPMAVVAGHRSADNRLVHLGDEEQPVPGVPLAGDVEVGIVPAS